MIKAVIIDLGGVFIRYREIDFYGGVAKFLNTDLSKTTKEAKKLVPLIERNEITEKEFWKILASRLKVKIKKDYKNYLSEDLDRKAKVNIHVKNLVVKLKKLGLKTMMLSNTLEPHIKVEKKNKWFKNFDFVVLSARIGMRKPEKRIYRYVIRKLRMKPEEIAFIDNNKENIKSAKELGINSILFKNYTLAVKELKKCGVHGI